MLSDLNAIDVVISHDHRIRSVDREEQIGEAQAAFRLLFHVGRGGNDLRIRADPDLSVDIGSKHRHVDPNLASTDTKCSVLVYRLDQYRRYRLYSFSAVGQLFFGYQLARSMQQWVVARDRLHAYNLSLDLGVVKAALFLDIAQ